MPPAGFRPGRTAEAAVSTRAEAPPRKPVPLPAAGVAQAGAYLNFFESHRVHSADGGLAQTETSGVSPPSGRDPLHPLSYSIRRRFVMKSSHKALLLVAAALAATAAHAQYGSTPIKHVIVIFQENRTPDNLFQGLCTANGGVPGCSTSLESKYDIASTYVNADGQTVPLTPVGLATNFDLDHSHAGPDLNGTISGFNFEFKNQGIAGKPAAIVPQVCGANIFGCVVPAFDFSQFM